MQCEHVLTGLGGVVEKASLEKMNGRWPQVRPRFNDRLAQLKREFRREPGRLDTRMEELARTVDDRFGKVDEHFGKVDEQLGKVTEHMGQVQADMRKVELKLQATRDEVTATRSVLGELRVDFGDIQRTVSGRCRLLEDRFSKMLEASTLDYDDLKTVLEDVVERLERLEEREPPAA